MTPTITRWDGAYRNGWQDLIVPEAYQHPAKYSRGLIHRIYRHLLERGYVRPGQTVLDPFAGVGLGALDAMTYGLAWIGCELEPRFVALAQQNLELWRRRYGFTGGTVVQGDSRVLRQVLGGVHAGCVVGSPPFCSSLSSGETAAEMKARWPQSQLGGNWGQSYGDAPGQLGALPPGTPPAAVVSSPPYAGAGQVLGTHNGIDYSKVQGSGKGATPARVASGEGYGVTPGQLGNMAIVGSPPYAGSLHLNESVEADIARMVRKGVPVTGGAQSRTPVAAHQANQGYGHSAGQLGAMPAGAIVSSPPWENQLGNHDSRVNLQKLHDAMHRDGNAHGGPVGSSVGQDYGFSPEQLGNTTGDTFWSAASQIVGECAALLPVGAVACWVVKGYVSKGRLVDFPAQWLALCQAHGVRLLEEIHASLIEESGVQETLFGEAETVQTERKSFFRRLHERRPGAVRIDHETVLILVKEAH